MRDTFFEMEGDGLDFTILNYVGIEDLSENTIEGFPNLRNCSGENTYLPISKLLWYFIAEGVMFVLSKWAKNIIRIKMIYFDNVHGFIIARGKNALPNLKKKPHLYRIFKIYHYYILGNLRKKKGFVSMMLSKIVSFVARTYTTLLCTLILYFSLYSNKICLLIFIYLVIFFNYFIKINSTFLNYLKKHDIENVVDISKIKF